MELEMPPKAILKLAGKKDIGGVVNEKMVVRFQNTDN